MMTPPVTALPKELLKKPVAGMTGEEFLTLMSSALAEAVTAAVGAEKKEPKEPTPIKVESAKDASDVFIYEGRKYGVGVKAVMRKFHCGRSRATSLLQNDLKRAGAVLHLNSRRLLVDLEKMDIVYGQRFQHPPYTIV